MKIKFNEKNVIKLSDIKVGEMFLLDIDSDEVWIKASNASLSLKYVCLNDGFITDLSSDRIVYPFKGTLVED